MIVLKNINAGLLTCASARTPIRWRSRTTSLGVRAARSLPAEHSGRPARAVGDGFREPARPLLRARLDAAPVNNRRRQRRGRARWLDVSAIDLRAASRNAGSRPVPPAFHCTWALVLHSKHSNYLFTNRVWVLMPC